jgi:tRNA threonylcarbamoyladenosine biosynthesis protein TsaB
VNELILAIDTTHEFGSLALLKGTQVIEEVLLHSATGFGHILFERLAQLLERNGRSVREVDCFATTSGPGSFTGVRIGLVCIKGLAEATGKPAMAVSNLEVMSVFGSAPLRAIVLDGRRGEIYGGVYNERRELIMPEAVMPFPAWLCKLPEGELEFISTDFTPFAPVLIGTRFERAVVTTAPRALAAATGKIAYERYRAGIASGSASLDANYVRRSDAELFWKES